MVQNPYFNYYQQPTQPYMFYGLKGHPVSSLEEAKTTNIDFDGSVFFFPDLMNKKIYTKQILIDGTLLFNVYKIENNEKESDTQPEYATRAELQELVALIKQQKVNTDQSKTKKQEIIADF